MALEVTYIFLTQGYCMGAFFALCVAVFRSELLHLWNQLYQLSLKGNPICISGKRFFNLTFIKDWSQMMYLVKTNAVQN